MIVAIEGPSAVGKTTWCRARFGDAFVEEIAENVDAPDWSRDPPDQVAAFWVDHGLRRWRRALQLEREHGFAVCDGDPLGLGFSWALAQLGETSWRLFELELAAYSHAVETSRIGLVDGVITLEASDEELRLRKAGDPTRRRRRHELHLRLEPWCARWRAARRGALGESGLWRYSRAHLERWVETAVAS